MPMLERHNDDVGAAKYRSNMATAASRHDTIVIYLRNKAGVWRICDGLRNLRQLGQITDRQFKSEVSPGTGRVADLPGVTTATAKEP